MKDVINKAMNELRKSSLIKEYFRPLPFSSEEGGRRSDEAEG